MRLLLVLAASLAVACPGKRAPEPAPPAASTDAVVAVPPDAPAGDAMATKDPNAAPGSFSRGPSITPAAALVAWLDEGNTDLGRRTVRLPVWLTVSGTSVKAARIGAADAPDAIALKLKDAKLGISLADHARRACRGAPACGLWLEGTWAGGGVFDVSKVGAGFTAADDATYAEVLDTP